MGRAPCCDKASVKKGPWSPEEDAQLKDYIQTHGTGGNWIALPQKAGLKRCGKSCRLRWLNYLRPDIKHGEFSDHEDRIICNLFATIGSRWSVIASQLPGRTDNDIKNYWNTKLKKKMMIPFITNNPSPHHHLYQPPLLPLIQNSTPSSSASSPLSSFLENTNSSSYTASHDTCSLFSASDPSISFSSANFSNGHSSFHQPQENLMKMSHHHHGHGKEVEAAATTGYYNGGDQTTMVAAHNFGMEETQKVCDGDYYVNGLLWEENPPLDYGLEGIKHLISSTTSNNNNSCNNNFFLFDDSMNHQRALYYY